MLTIFDESAYHRHTYFFSYPHEIIFYILYGFVCCEIEEPTYLTEHLCRIFEMKHHETISFSYAMGEGYMFVNVFYEDLIS